MKGENRMTNANELNYGNRKNDICSVKAADNISSYVFEHSKTSAGNASEMCLAEYLKDWIRNVTGIKETTRNVYAGHISNHIIPAIGDIVLSRIDTALLQGFVTLLELAPSTVRVVYNVLRSALKHAHSMNLIEDVYSDVVLPKRVRTKKIVLTRDEQRRLEQAIYEPEDIGVLICLYTGIRIGELCALRWKDIDQEARVMRICGTQARIDGEIRIIPPKSEMSSRSIPIPECIAKLLTKDGSSSEYVISGKNGEPMDVRTYRRRFKRLLKKAGLPDIQFHALRHTFSTRAIEVGMDYRTLSEILGHSSVAITLDLYAHSLDAHKRMQMDKINMIYNR